MVFFGSIVIFFPLFADNYQFFDCYLDEKWAFSFLKNECLFFHSNKKKKETHFFSPFYMPRQGVGTKKKKVLPTPMLSILVSNYIYFLLIVSIKRLITVWNKEDTFNNWWMFEKTFYAIEKINRPLKQAFCYKIFVFGP